RIDRMRGLARAAVRVAAHVLADAGAPARQRVPGAQTGTRHPRQRRSRCDRAVRRDRRSRMTAIARSADPEPAAPEHSGLSAFSPDRPLLLLSDFSPEMAGGGAVILNSLLTAEDRERIVWVTLSPLKHR